MTREPMSEESSRLFRDVLSTFCSGVTIVTGTSDASPAGLTCQSFFSVSISPPLVAYSVARRSTSFPSIRVSGQCCVNILAADQAEVGRGFGRPGPEKWSGIEWHPSRMLGNPVIDDVVSWLDCTIEAEHEAGDHTIVLAQIVDMAVEREVPPLLFSRGEFVRLEQREASAPSRRTP